MTTWLYVLPQRTSDLDAQPCWLIRDTDEVTDLVLGDCPSKLKGEPVKVLVPMERFGVHRCAPWRHRRKPSVETLLFELEEHLLQPLEQLKGWRGSKDANGRYDVWVTDAEHYDAMVSYLRRALPEMAGVYIDGEVCATAQPGAMWLAGRWLVCGEGLPRLAASDPWLSALERAGDQTIPRLATPSSLWRMLEHSKGLDLLDSRRERTAWPWASTFVIALGAFGLVGAAEYRMGSTLAASNLILAQRNELRLAQLYPGQPSDPERLAHLFSSGASKPMPWLPQLTGLLHQLDAVPGVRVHTIERGLGQPWRLNVSAGRLEDIHFDPTQWRLLNMAVEGERWQGTLEGRGP